MSTTLTVIDTTGASVGEVEIQEAWLEREKGDQAVHQMVVAHLANRRAGTACTKTRGEVSGGGAKPWRQKGTGRARAGSNRSPVWRGGGTIFGPRPRDYSQKVNKKIRRLALRRAFTGCLDAEKVKVVNELALAEPRSALLHQALKGVGAGRKTVIVLANDDAANLKQAARNLSEVLVTTAGRLNVYTMLRADTILICQDAVEALGQRLA